MGKMVRHATCLPGAVAEAVYGLPEINRSEIKGARVIANPGCYPTAVQLGFMPLIEAGVVELNGLLVADCKSGVSGAGRKAEVAALFSEASDNFKAYGVAGHRHLAGNSSRACRGCAGKPVQSDFRAASDAVDPRHSCHALCAPD